MPETGLSDDFTIAPARSASRLAMTSIPEDTASRRLTASSRDDDDDEEEGETTDDDSSEDLDMYTRNLEERERLAIRAAAEPKYIPEWGFFLKCYLEV